MDAGDAPSPTPSARELCARDAWGFDVVDTPQKDVDRAIRVARAREHRAMWAARRDLRLNDRWHRAMDFEWRARNAPGTLNRVELRIQQGAPRPPPAVARAPWRVTPPVARARGELRQRLQRPYPRHHPPTYYPPTASASRVLPYFHTSVLP